ncbi:hypothetical protein MASR2M78_28000 [Treponema sp.]
MVSVPKESIVDFHSQISSLISDSERLFLSFGETYPAFIRELAKSLEAANKDLDGLGVGKSLDDAIHILFDGTRYVIKDAGSKFKSMHDRDENLQASLSRGIEVLSSLDEVIARIKDDSIEMELISLNAMTVALKSGSTGKAFSVITDELKKLSVRTIALTDLLNEAGKELLLHLKSYSTYIDDLEAKRDALFSGLEERLVSRFEDLEKNLHIIATTLSQIIQDSKGLEKPVRNIMERIQVQDIVKQSLDHVLMALDELLIINDYSETEERVFCQRLLFISASILSDVREKLDSAQKLFFSESESIHTLVQEGERQRRQLLNDSFDQSFQETFAVLESIKTQVEGYLKAKTSITQLGLKLSVSVVSLESHFRSFTKILTRFKTIDIASRIEVSKQAALRSMHDTVNEMSILTDRIGSDVAEALKTTQLFIGDTKTAIQSYSEMMDEERIMINVTNDNLSLSHQNLGNLRETLLHGVKGFTLFTTSFLKLLDKPAEDVRALGAIVGNLDSLLYALRILNTSLSGSEADSASMDEVKSERLKEIIKRFTIYAHKKSAVQIGGITSMDLVDEDIGSDEVVFF